MGLSLLCSAVKSKYRSAVLDTTLSSRVPDILSPQARTTPVQVTAHLLPLLAPSCANVCDFVPLAVKGYATNGELG